MRPDVCCTGPRPCAGAGGRWWSIRVRNTFPLISGETSCADTQMQIFVCKNNLQFSWTSQVFPHMLMLMLTAVGVELPSHWAVSSCPVSVGHWSCDVKCLYKLQQWCHEAVWRLVIILPRYGWWHVMPRLCRMHVNHIAGWPRLCPLIVTSAGYWLRDSFPSESGAWQHALRVTADGCR